MGRSYVVNTIVELTSTNAGGNAGTLKMEWKKSTYGAPNAKNLQTYIAKFEASTASGGVNEHLGTHRVLSAAIRNDVSGEVLTRYAA